MDKLIYILETFIETTGRVLAPLTFVMMVLTCAIVVARYVFNIGAIPIQESIVYLHGAVFMLGIAYTLKQSGHVRVDIVYQRCSEDVQTLIDLFGTIIFLFPVGIFLLWTSIDFVSFSWSLKESSPEPGGLPFVYLLKTLLPIMAILLLIQGFAEFL
ncbi:MAG: TRAP-type mannitol/chloroaromatic compound transport system permease small subunit, partial [Flavobacterium sp.]